MNIIRKYRKSVVVFSVLGLTVTCTESCKKDFLDTVPVTSISVVTAFDTPERISAQVNGLYSAVKNSQFYGGRYTIYNELRADEFIMNKPNVQTGQLTWTQTVNASTQEVTGLWSAGYAAINRIHVFMEGLEANKAKVDATLFANYLAEAKFLRALSYFALVQTYAKPYTDGNGANPGLPLRLNAEKTADNNDLARSTVAEIYAQVLKDLNEAETGLPLTYTTGVLNTTRAHRNSAISLKTRVYLCMGDYAKVMTEAAKIVSPAAPFQAPTGVNNKLESNVITVFGGAYTGNEATFSLPMNALDAPGGQNALAYYFTFTPGNAEFYLNTAGTVSDPVFASTSADARKGLVATQQSLLWLYKFKVAATYSDYIPVIRYAETLLNYSEAAARTGNLALATDLLNAVRKRSHPAYVFPLAATSTQTALINTILQERKIELLGEGFRVPDLLRTLKPLPGKTGAAGSSPAVSTTESKYIWPISSAELATNKLCIPNP